jgi:hypothetical protein
MKIITYSKVGYNSPASANWAYGIWKVDLIDTSSNYCMSYTLKETFGGEERLKAQLDLRGITAIETKGVYPLPKVTGVAKLMDIENVEILDIIEDFMMSPEEKEARANYINK